MDIGWGVEKIEGAFRKRCPIAVVQAPSQLRGVMIERLEQKHQFEGSYFAQHTQRLKRSGIREQPSEWAVPTNDSELGEHRGGDG